MQAKRCSAWLWLAILALAILALAACAAPAAPTGSPTTLAATRAGALTPYHTPSPQTSAAATHAATLSPLPSATPTARLHAVQPGEDMFGISLLYGVALADIRTANPTVNPRAMSIGTELIIPAALTPSPTPLGGPPADQVTPTPLPAEAGALECIQARDGGIWCFQLVRNPHDFPLEGLTARFTLTGSSGAGFSQTAFLLLDTLPPGQALPLTSYFTPAAAANLGERFSASGELIAALPNPADGRYLPARLENQQVFISADGLTAEARLDVILEAADTSAGRVWVASTAYDAAGRVVGVRRWESAPGETLASGQPLAVALRVYSAAGPISRVELLAEARP